MGIDKAKLPDIKQSTMDSISETNENAYAKLLQKQQEYKAYMKQLDIFNEKLYFAERKYNSQLSLYRQGRSNSLASAQSLFSNLKAQTGDIEINTEVARDSLNNASSYANMTSNSLFLAQSILG